jgi:hypothetical protein
LRGIQPKRDWILYPFLFSIYPVSLLFAHNIEEAPFSSVLRPLLISLLGALLIYFLLKLVIHDRYKSAIVTTLILILFFSYGHIYNFLENTSLLGFALGRHRILFPLWIFLLGVGFWWAVRSKKSLQPLTKPLNLIAVLLLIFPLAQIGLYTIQTYRFTTESKAATSDINPLHLPESQPAPDIYYIILDAYSRDDILKKFYQVDNTGFLNQLSQMGFYVARCSQSNYAQTQLSLASSLNFNYLDQLGKEYTPGNTSRVGLSNLIQHSKLRQALEKLGYKTIAFDTGYDPTRLVDADLYLSPNKDQGINDFENLFVRTTAARLLSEGVTLLNLPPDWEARDEAHRQRILFALDKLPTIPDLPGKKFVFIHMVIPHWPHVFGPNGEPVHEHSDSVVGYRNQVIFINKQIIPVLNEIIARSKTPPVIIIQGDHGSIIESPLRRMSILNAYYLPGNRNQNLYQSISPVNTFRVILNTYFGGKYGLLNDVSYYSVYDQPYDYTIIPDSRPGCNAK